MYSQIGFNIWTKVLEITVKKDIEILSGRIDGPLYSEYKEITMSLFEASDDRIPELNKKLLTQINTNHEIVIIKKDGIPIGTACFVVNNQTCWMFGGSVFPKFRNQGYWKYLIQLRQKMSLKYGAKYWFIQTVIDEIRGKSDLYFELDCYKKFSLS